MFVGGVHLLPSLRRGTRRMCVCGRPRREDSTHVPRLEPACMAACGVHNRAHGFVLPVCLARGR
jgi:hypothetical protein